jgi:hypothetical protein
MVKKLSVFLGILSLTMIMAGGAFAFFGGGGCGDGCMPKPMYVPVDCPPYPCSTTIIKTWSAKIEGPCPGPMPMCGKGCDDMWGWHKTGLFGGLAAAIATPFDFLFGGIDGVYGCCPDLLGGGRCNPCGPAFGPLPGAITALPMIMAAPTTTFGMLW